MFVAVSLKPMKKTFRSVLVPLLVLCAPLSGYSVVVFENDGTLSGWTSTASQNLGSNTQVTSPNYRTTTANTSIKHHQQFVANSTTRFHSECNKASMGGPGWDRYFGWALYLPTSWSFTSGTYI